MKFHDGDTGTDLATRAAVCTATTAANSTVSNLEDSSMSFFDGSGVEDPSSYVLLPTDANYQFMDINNFVDLLGLHGYVGTNLDSSIMSMRSWCVAAMPIPQEWSAIENMKVNITSGVSYQFMDMTATPPA